MERILAFFGSVALFAVYVWVIGTLIWMLFVVPRMYKRQDEILRRLSALEKRIVEVADSSRKTSF